MCDQAIALGVRQRIEQRALDHREARGRRPRRQGQRDGEGDGVERLVAEQAQDSHHAGCDEQPRCHAGGRKRRDFGDGTSGVTETPGPGHAVFTPVRPRERVHDQSLAKQTPPLRRRNRLAPARRAHRCKERVEQRVDLVRAHAEAGCHAGCGLSARQQLEGLPLTRRDSERCAT